MNDGGISMDSVDALMVTLASHSESLGSKDVQATGDIYNAIPNAEAVADTVKGMIKSSSDSAKQGESTHCAD